MAKDSGLICFQIPQHVLMVRYTLRLSLEVICYRRNLIIDREAREIICLVASVCPSVRQSVRLSAHPSTDALKY